jgi:uncharacterized protein YkwD
MLLAFTVAACGGGAARPPADQDVGLMALLNERRVESGCAVVGPNDALTAAAQRHAADMRQHGMRDHTGSDGSSPAQRMEQAGFAGSGTGEILYFGTGGGAPEAVNGWMNSAGHREIIQDCRFTHAGVAEIRDGREYFAVVAFGADSGTLPR